MSEYQRIKFDVATCPTILPKKEIFSGTPNAARALSTKEDKLTFIGDVEKFVKYYTNNEQGNAYCPMPAICVREVFLFCLAEHVWLSEVFPNLKYDATDMPSVKKVYMSFGQLAKRFRMISERQKNHGMRIPKRLMHGSNLFGICKDIREKAEGYFISKKMIID